MCAFFAKVGKSHITGRSTPSNLKSGMTKCRVELYKAHLQFVGQIFLILVGPSIYRSDRGPITG